jgi:hypothetical protein
MASDTVIPSAPGGTVTSLRTRTSVFSGQLVPDWFPQPPFEKGAVASLWKPAAAASNVGDWNPAAAQSGQLGDAQSGLDHGQQQRVVATAGPAPAVGSGQ